ncbi:hypothetical protein MRX96_038932 [Rhipicephalus microplus]
MRSVSSSEVIETSLLSDDSFIVLVNVTTSVSSSALTVKFNCMIGCVVASCGVVSFSASGVTTIDKALTLLSSANTRKTCSRRPTSSTAHTVRRHTKMIKAGMPLHGA